MRGERLPQWIDGDPELQRARLACGLFKQMDRLIVLAHTRMDSGDGRDLHVLRLSKHEEFVQHPPSSDTIAAPAEVVAKLSPRPQRSGRHAGRRPSQQLDAFIEASRFRQRLAQAA